MKKLHPGVRFRFVQIAAAAAVLASALQIGSCATVERRTSDLTWRIVRDPRAFELRFAHGLPTVRCWFRIAGQGLPSAPSASLNGVERLSVSYEELASGRAHIQIRQRTTDGRADSVFTWGVGDTLVLTFPDAFGVITPEVQSWELFRAEGSEPISDSSTYSSIRFWLNVAKTLFVVIAVLGAILASEGPRRESLIVVLLREQIEDISYGTAQETKWMQQILTVVLLGDDPNVKPRDVANKLTPRAAEQLKLTRDFVKCKDEVLAKSQDALKEEVSAYSHSPDPPASPGAAST